MEGLFWNCSYHPKIDASILEAPFSQPVLQELKCLDWLSNGHWALENVLPAWLIHTESWVGGPLSVLRVVVLAGAVWKWCEIWWGIHGWSTFHLDLNLSGFFLKFGGKNNSANWLRNCCAFLRNAACCRNRKKYWKIIKERASSDSSQIKPESEFFHQMLRNVEMENNFESEFFHHLTKSPKVLKMRNENWKSYYVCRGFRFKGQVTLHGSAC